jgi:hypothetical protein
MTTSGNCTQSDFFFNGTPETALLNLPDATFLQTVLPPKQERSVFEVTLEEYPTQPWIRYHKTRDDSQWFNYNMNAKTFKDYAAEQVRIDTELRKRYATALAAYQSASRERAMT